MCDTIKLTQMGAAELVTSVLTRFLLCLQEEIMVILLKETNCYDTTYIQHCTMKPNKKSVIWNDGENKKQTAP
jgi:hypothetical protein